MKLVLIGSYGHAGAVLNSPALGRTSELAGVARYGPEDPMKLPDHLGGGVPLWDDAEAMLREVRPDIAAVCTPLYRIGPTARLAVELGCRAVICEKPLATTRQDFDALAEAVLQHDVQLAALMTMRDEPAFRAARRALRNGRAGRPVQVFAQKSYPFASRDDFYKDRRTYGGSILWQAIHAIDLIGWTTGLELSRVAALADNADHPTHPGMEDHGGLLVQLAPQGTAVVSFDYLRPWPGGGGRSWGDDRLRVACTEGVVEVRDRRAWLLGPREEVELTGEPAGDLVGECLSAWQNRSKPPISTAESLRITDVALRARDAADSRCWADLPDTEGG